MQGIKTLEKPIEVNTIDWAFEHLGCDALIIKDDRCNTMSVLAYAIEPKYNKLLYDLLMHHDNSIIFKNTDKDEVNAID
ncbi:MAG: hypothetical protein HDR25_05445 [Lachnospiraceae bacterium]|nr:hypothetical protein [Lachnospiraceae bacterium]